MKKGIMKKIGIFAMIIAMSVLVMACSSDNDDAGGQTSTEDSTGSTEGGSDEGITIRLVHYMGEQAKRDALDQMIEVFERDNQGINVDVEVVASSSYVATYKNYIAAGEAPDIMFGKPQTLTEFVEAGYFMDLSGEKFLDDVLPILVDECTVNDGVYGFPIDAQVKATFYNKTMFEENDIKVPTTKDEFFEATDAFMEKDIYPIIHPYNFIHGVFHELDSFFTSMAVGTGNETVWVDSQEGTAELSGNPVILEALEMFSKFATYRDPGDTAIDQTQGIQNFAAGQRPMYMNGGWLMGDVMAANPDGEFGMFPTPWSDNSEENKLYVGIDDVFIVSQDTEHKDAVVKLLESFASEESSEIWMNTAKLMSSNTAVSTDDADVFIQEIKQYIDDDMIVSKSLVPDYTSEFSIAFRTKLQYFVTLEDDERDVDQLITEIDEEIASIRQ